MVNFYSIQFVLFLGIVLVAYYTFLKKHQWICLLIASALFYYCTGIENFIFILVTGISTWLGGMALNKKTIELQMLRSNKAIESEIKNSKKKQILHIKRVIMWSTVFLNFGMLSCIKINQQMLGWVLPLGISFYIFQSVGYLLDIYNEKYKPEQNFARYMLFVSYFPQMIQGPINRYDKLGIQFGEEHVWSDEKVTKAIYKIGYGLLKKYAIANTFAVIIANIFDTPVKEFSGAMTVFGILLYSVQQYADFSGGIDMVLGVSELFGIQMQPNFRQPYFSISLADFWRRWHMSLGHWMRDYVFYPFALTKNMKKFGKWANQTWGKHMGRVLPGAIGNILVFFIVGIWHGTEWHYVLWGLYNGIIIALSDILAPVYQKMITVLHIDIQKKIYRIFQIVRTFIVVNIGWYFDRIYNVEDVLKSMQKTIFSFNASSFATEYGLVLDGVRSGGMVLAVIGCVLVFIVSLLEENNTKVRELIYKSPTWIRWGVYTFTIMLILISSTRVGDVGGFMYANF